MLRQAVEAMSGPVVVIAGPGSGKTRTLTYRIAHLVRERGVDPGQILAVTFTNRAAGEMRARLEELLAGMGGLERLRVGTFHRIALELLRECGATEKTVLDELEARRVVGEVLGENRLALRPGQALEAISLAKSAGLKADDLEELGRTAYRAYQERLAAYRARDYDDILLDLLSLLEEDEEILTRVRERFPHLLVDEFQDVNAVQYRLVTLLADRGRGLFAIGDPDQAIYGFRGAEPRFFGTLRRDFSGVRLFHLETNYRSRGNIVRAAAGVIGHNAVREEMRLRAVQEAGAPVRLLSVPGETAEGIAVVREIGRMVGGADMVQADQGVEGGRSSGDFAVLFRTGRQAGVLEECFLKEGQPYRLIGQRGFLEAESVRQALAFCRYALRPEEGLRLLHALELEIFGAGKKVMEEMRGRMIDGRGMDGLSAPAATSLKKLEETVAKFRGLGAETFLQKWLEESGAEDEDLEHLIRVAAAAESLEELLDTLLLGRDADYERAGEGAMRGEAVTLMTLHAAKGLEFPVIFICGVEDGLIPFREREADLQEERRLFYVGLTRAQEEVLLLRTRSRLRYGERLQPGVSPFAWEIPSDLLIEERVEPPRKREDAEQMSLF